MYADILRIPVGPGSLHVERFGRGGTPVVLVHGFGTYGFLWRNIAPRIAEAGHTAFVIDLLGYGESDRPIDAEYGISAQSEYLDHALTALRVARAVVVGVDVGGAIAMRLATQRGERVERLVLVNPIAFDDVPAGDVKQLQRNTARFAIRVSQGMFGAAPLLTPLLRGSVADPDHMPDALLGRYLAPFVGEGGVSHLLGLMRSLRSEDLEVVNLSAIRAPTLIVWGDADRWTDTHLPAKLAESIPRCRLARIPDAARLVPEDSPDEFVDLLLDFLGTTEASRRARERAASPGVEASSAGA
jgi:pimeloyl-ACP methyl ester carboxylesterase